QRLYIYGRSEPEVYRQVLRIRKDLTRHTANAFSYARGQLRSNSMIQVGLQDVMARPLSAEEKAALNKELNAYDYRKPPTNRRYVELRAKLAALVSNGQVPKQQAGEEALIAQELLLGDLAQIQPQ